MDRRGFLKALGLGAAAAAVLPIEDLIDRLVFARSPTTSIYLPSAGLSDAVRQWEDGMFAEYARSHSLFEGLRWSDQDVIAIKARHRLPASWLEREWSGRGIYRS